MLLPSIIMPKHVWVVEQESFSGAYNGRAVGWTILCFRYRAALALGRRRCAVIPGRRPRGVGAANSSGVHQDNIACLVVGCYGVDMRMAAGHFFIY